MWRNLFRPDVLFTITAIQALSPYLFWRLGWGVPLTHDNLTYLPVPIWIVGCISFVIGTRFMYRELPHEPNYVLTGARNQISFMLIVLLAFILVQAVLITRVYGTLPILSYLRQDGKINIVTANQLQDESAMGQIGLFDLSMSWLNGILLLLLLVHVENKKKLSFLIVMALLFVIAGNLINGKRQGLVRAMVYLTCGLSLYSSRMSVVLTRLLPIPRNKFVISLCLVVFLTGVVYSFGYVALIRNQGEFDRDALSELTVYQEYPLLNLEAQCRDAGLGPYQFNFFYPFQRLVPYKLMHAIDFTQLDPPVRVEPSAPAGFYEDIQWSLGPIGVIGFSFFTGMLGTYFYSRALDSPPHLLIYCQMAYNLFVSHSFNEFLILAYFPGVLTFFIICAPLNIMDRKSARAALSRPLLILRRTT
jgi:oligosaccharide repeat unit polymerase